jgi:ABC-type amino acid transport substrate-binding protein
VARVNSDAVENLSAIDKDFKIQSHDKFYEVTRDIMWLNLTVDNQSNMYMAIRQLEFSLLQLVQQFDDLLAALQALLHGRLTMTLINPTTLQYILRNVSFQLPENYELVAKLEKIAFTYTMI